MATAHPGAGRVDRSGRGSERASVPVPRVELLRLGEEVATAMRAVVQARAATDAVDALSQVTVAIEALSAVQHELVNVLLDHGHTWGEVGKALSTSPSAAERRFPRRERREGGPGESSATAG